MSKAKSVYVCGACGASSSKWLGRCPSCGAWNSLVEEVVSRTAATKPANAARKTVRLGDVRAGSERRSSTGIAELDRVLGGGLVEGSVLLLGGDPGIGKSTLLLQALANLSSSTKVLYASGEESAPQVAMRAERLGGAAEIALLATTELDDVLAALDDRPRVAVVDSVQTMRSSSLDSPPGSVGQLREVANVLVERAKASGTAIVLVGHVTKDGSLAGPKVLEHVVDTVLSFEGERGSSHRLLRVTKNRFGPSHEIALFEMVREGLREVAEPSALFLSERPSDASGSVVASLAEASRPLLVEVQALVSSATYGAPRRVATGLDGSRLAVLIAVLERKAGVMLADRDVFVSVAGGARVDERALDLPMAIAIASSARDRPVPSDMVVFGEVGLAGEIRSVPRGAGRVAESLRLGYSRIVLPDGLAASIAAEVTGEVTLIPVKRLDAALEAALGARGPRASTAERSPVRGAPPADPSGARRAGARPSGAGDRSADAASTDKPPQRPSRA